jgi:hypothetical protein
LTDKDGNVDISGNSSVKFYMRNVETGNKKIDGKEMDVLNASTGRVEYNWDNEDVDTAGVFKAEIVVNFDDGDQPFPSDDFKSIKIGEDIEEA